jgi:hypothetical protein
MSSSFTSPVLPVYSLPRIFLISSLPSSSSNSHLRSRSSLRSSECEGVHASSFSEGSGAGIMWKCTCELTVNVCVQD